MGQYHFGVTLGDDSVEQLNITDADCSGTVLQSFLLDYLSVYHNYILLLISTVHDPRFTGTQGFFEASVHAAAFFLQHAYTSPDAAAAFCHIVTDPGREIFFQRTVNFHDLFFVGFAFTFQKIEIAVFIFIPDGFGNERIEFSAAVSVKGVAFPFIKFAPFANFSTDVDFDTFSGTETDAGSRRTPSLKPL